MYLTNGTLLQGGKYKIVSFINSGGFGNTYEGEHILLKKRVAIKEFFIKDYCNRDEETATITVGITAKSPLVQKLKKKFIEEAQAISTLNHPNIVNVYDVFEENGTAYYVMDYIDGHSLGEMLKQNGAMGEKQAMKYILQVAEALKYVHSRNRLHLDVKPGNIMVDANDNAILIDFGASKQYDEVAGENTSTLTGKTPGYAPLEQMGNDVLKFYPSTDIYALGATIYKLLTNVSPISATRLASGEELQPLPMNISENVRKAVYRAMQTNKNARPQSIDEFLAIFKVNNSPASDKLNGKYILGACAVLLVAVCCFFAFRHFGSSATPSGVPSDSDSIGTVIDHSKDSLLEQLGQLKDKVKTKHVTGETFNDADGQSFTYTGEVIDNKPNGQGTGIYPYGNYTGEYKDGLRHGRGKFETKNGKNKFDGTFAKDLYDEGRLTKSDGLYFEGNFKGGDPYNGKWYDENGNIISNVVNGK